MSTIYSLIKRYNILRMPDIWRNKLYLKGGKMISKAKSLLSVLLVLLLVGVLNSFERIQEFELSVQEFDLCDYIECIEVHPKHGKYLSDRFIDPVSGLLIQIKKVPEKEPDKKEFLIWIEFRKRGRNWQYLHLHNSNKVKHIVYIKSEETEKVSNQPNEKYQNVEEDSITIAKLRSSTVYPDKGIHLKIQGLNQMKGNITHDSVYFMNPDDLYLIGRNDKILPMNRDRLRIKIFLLEKKNTQDDVYFMRIQKSIELQYRKKRWDYSVFALPSYIYKYNPKNVGMPGETPSPIPPEPDGEGDDNGYGFVFAISFHPRYQPFKNEGGNQLLKFLINNVGYHITLSDISLKEPMKFGLGFTISPMFAQRYISFLIGWRGNDLYTGVAFNLSIITDFFEGLFKSSDKTE